MQCARETADASTLTKASWKRPETNNHVLHHQERRDFTRILNTKTLPHKDRKCSCSFFFEYILVLWLSLTFRNDCVFQANGLGNSRKTDQLMTAKDLLEADLSNESNREEQLLSLSAWQLGTGAGPAGEIQIWLHLLSKRIFCLLSQITYTWTSGKQRKISVS